MSPTAPCPVASAPTPAAAPVIAAEYGRAYQLHQASKYRDRAANHWRLRVDLAHRLAREHAYPRLGLGQDGRTGGAGAGRVRVVDVGCSIGTFAIEFARLGFDSVGVDMDPEALDIARDLAAEEGVTARFDCADLAAWDDPRPIDLAVAFDIFEHLHDDQMGALLQTIRRRLSPRGVLIFHTFPTEFDYLFFERGGRGAEPLLPYADADPREFERRTRALAARLDAEAIEGGGLPRRDAIRLERHCNPTCPRRLRWQLERAGLEVLSIQTAQLYPFEPELAARFAKQPLTHRNLFGAAGLRA